MKAAPADTPERGNMHDGPPMAQGDGPETARLMAPSRLEQALALALERASAAGEWGVVMALADELRARRG